MDQGGGSCDQEGGSCDQEGGSWDQEFLQSVDLAEVVDTRAETAHTLFSKAKVKGVL